MPALSDPVAEARAYYSRRSRTKRIVELDGLRGLAALLVVTKHYHFVLPGQEASEAAALANRIYYSFSGADFFVVLMGFLLGGTLIDACSSPRYFGTFFARRACRILPLYYLMLLVVALAVLLGGALTRLVPLFPSWPFDTAWSMVVYVCFLQNFWMVYEGTLGPRWLEVTWALAMIEQFYLLLPWFVRQFRYERLGYALAALFVWAPMSRFLLPYILPRFDSRVVELLPFFRTDTLCAGILAAVVVRNASCRRFLTSHRDWLGALALVLAIGYGWLIYAEEPLSIPFYYCIRYSYLAILYSTLLLMGLFGSDGFFGGMLRTRPLCALGRISYGVFLFHQPVGEVVSTFLFGTSGFMAGEGWESVLGALMAFSITAALATVAWRFVEKPVMDWSKRFTY